MSAKLLTEIFRKTLEATSPELLVLQTIKRQPGELAPIVRKSQILLFGAGKAARRMAKGAAAALGKRVVGGLVIVPENQEDKTEGDDAVFVEFGTHPLPSVKSIRATEALIEEIDKCKPTDGAIFLLSGGASSLLEYPARAVTPEQLIESTRKLLLSGAPITQINTIRKTLSAVKGGRLSPRFKCPVAAIVLSDVAGNSFATIGSGPLFEGEVKVPHVLAGDGLLMARCAEGSARLLGVDSTTIELNENPVEGDVFDVAREYAEYARANRGKLLIRFGEPTVKLPASGVGKGGRNQHLALAVARLLLNEKNWAFLSCGSDGIDGDSPAAGACVEATSWATAEKEHLNPAEALERFDSHRVHLGLKTHVQTGPTGNNLQDLHLLWLGT